ncbi:hypothetical protein Aros01_09314 [Streptosporangium roseum]
MGGRVVVYTEARGRGVGHRAGGPPPRYAADAAAVVRHIRTLLAAGLPTRVIRDLLPCVAGDGPELEPCVIDHLREQLGGLDERISGLQETRTALAALLETTERAGVGG